MATEEFTFPTINNNIKRLTATPSLWRISSLEVYSDLDIQLEVNGRKGLFRKSFYDDIKETERKLHHVSTEEEVENKMDSLWEDFNDDNGEELEGQSSPESSNSEDQEARDAAELCTKKGSTGLVLPQKKHKTIMVLKVFMKKLLLIQKMASVKRSSS